MELIIKWLATLFEAFKTKNPITAMVIILIAGSAVVTVNNGELYGLFSLPEWGRTVVSAVSLFILAVTGSQTFRYLPAEKQQTARK